MCNIIITSEAGEEVYIVAHLICGVDILVASEAIMLLHPLMDDPITGVIRLSLMGNRKLISLSSCLLSTGPPGGPGNLIVDIISSR